MNTPTHILLNILLPEHSITRLSPDGARAQTADGSDVTIWWFRTPQQAKTALSALELLRGTQKIPALRAADVTGTVSQRPAIVVDSPSGVPLGTIIDRLSTTQQHAIGRQLGNIVADIHQHAVPSYGALHTPGYQNHKAQLQIRITEAITRLIDAQLLTSATGDALNTLIAATVTDDHTDACLIHGALGPDSIWIDRSGTQPAITTVTSWNSAFGGRPAAEHVRLADACANDAYFALRIGYGEVYDERCQRPSDQLRERTLLPERLSWVLSKAAHAATHAQPDEATRLLTIIQRWCDAIQQSASATEEEYT